MWTWLSGNIASVSLLVAVAAIVFFLLKSSIDQKKKGTCSCGCGSCGGCSARKYGGKHETD